MLANQSRILINSIPKSGTHLLSKAVELFNYREHYDARESTNTEPPIYPIFLNYKEVKQALLKENKLEQRDSLSIPIGTLAPIYVEPDIFADWMAAVPQGRYILGHVVWQANLSVLLKKLNYCHLFIIRDPRAVLASLLCFILDARGMPKKHFLEADFKLLSPKQRLSLILDGGYVTLADVNVEPFCDIFRSMLAWKTDADCLVLRFEDLIGEKGGGTTHQQKKAVQQIASYLGKTFSEQVATEFQKIYNPAARTFRKGSIDSWKHTLDAEDIGRVNEYCQPLCSEAGYQ